MTRGPEPVEVELKIVLPGPEAEPEIVEKIQAQGYRIKELNGVTNVDLYLDTFDWMLLKKDISLRYRVTDDKALYTIKSLGPIEGGIAKRMEIETPLDGPVPRPAEIQLKQIRDVIDGIISPRKLVEQILIRTERRRYRVVSPDKAKFELAFDTASFSLKGLHKPRSVRKLHELEAELLAGPEAALNSLARQLFASFAYPPSTTSKFQAALERFRIGAPSKKIPQEFVVRPDDRLDLAARKILAFQWRRFSEQIPGIKHDIDTEFVHQARVATRRMRSSLRLFREALPQNTGEYFAGELMWLGGMLGAVRDLDVFLLNLAHYSQQLERLPGKQKTFFENWLLQHRQGPLAALGEALDSPRYKTFEKRLSRFLEGPLPLRPRAPLAIKQVSTVAPPIINERLEAVIKRGHAVLANPKIKQFHRLRIQMKRLRYACEFMAPAYDGALDPFIEHTVEIQDCLGEIQDTVFTRSFIDTLFDDWKRTLVSPDLIFVLGEIYQLQREIAADRQRKFGKIWERFASEETIRQLKEILARMAPKDKLIAASEQSDNNLLDS